MQFQLAITGPTGFIATHLAACANSRNVPLRPVTRPLISYAPDALAGCHAVLHLAARAHILRETESDPLAAYRKANTEATLQLAKAAIAAGVQRFVFVSSIGVLGNHSCGQPLRPDATPHPVEDYAHSKAEAEVGLGTLCSQAGMELVIIRPPLVHGPGAKGNFHRLMGAIHAARPLPLGGVRNRRSFIGVENLANALLTAATAPMPRTGHAATYHVADEGVISTRRLVEVLAEGLGVAPRLLSIPRWLAVGGATLLGKRAMAKRLFDDLEVDDSDFRRDFGWKPTISLEDGLRAMAADYATRARKERSDG